MSKAQNGHVYRHYKKESMLYTVLESCALDCNTTEPLVIYRSEYSTTEHKKGTVWVRARSDFESQVKLTNGTIVERFNDIS